MEPQPSSPPPEPTPFERMTALAKQVMSVPKAEIERRAEKNRKQPSKKRTI